MCRFLERFPVINPLNNNVKKWLIVGPLVHCHCAGRLRQPFEWASPRRSKDSPTLLTGAVKGSSSGSSCDRCQKSAGQKRKYSRVFTASAVWFHHPRAKLLVWIATLKASQLGSVCVILPWFHIKPGSCFVSAAVLGWFKTCSPSLCCFDGWDKLVCAAAAGAEQHLCWIFREPAGIPSSLILLLSFQKSSVDSFYRSTLEILPEMSSSSVIGQTCWILPKTKIVGVTGAAQASQSFFPSSSPVSLCPRPRFALCFLQTGFEVNNINTVPRHD